MLFAFITPRNREAAIILAVVCIVLYGLGTCLLAVFYRKGHFWLKNGVEVGFCYCDASNLKPEGVKIDLTGESGIELLPLHAEIKKVRRAREKMTKSFQFKSKKKFQNG